MVGGCWSPEVVTSEALIKKLRIHILAKLSFIILKKQQEVAPVESEGFRWLHHNWKTHQENHLSQRIFEMWLGVATHPLSPPLTGCFWLRCWWLKQKLYLQLLELVGGKWTRQKASAGSDGVMSFTLKAETQAVVIRSGAHALSSTDWWHFHI